MPKSYFCLPSILNLCCFLFRRVCCWEVCFLWSMLCARRSWIATTLFSKVSKVQVCLFTCLNGGVSCSNVACFCSVNTVAEEGKRMPGWSVEGNGRSASAWQRRPAAAAHARDLDQCRKSSKSINVLMKKYSFWNWHSNILWSLLQKQI